MRISTTLACSILALSAMPAAADPVRLLAADERGVTLQVSVPAWKLEAGLGNRSELSAQGLQAFDIPGRPALPFASALVALRQGARAQVRGLSADSEEQRDGVRLTPASKPVFREAAEGVFPDREPVAAIQDGSWPASPVELGTPFHLRRQR